jgi:non-ribosomal peptide synthetase component F
MFFAFPEDARWNADRQAVEFGVEIGEYRSVVRVPRRVFQRLLPERPTPERCVGACHLLRTRFESIAERKLRRRQLTEDGNVEISGRDLRKVLGGNRADSRGASQIDPKPSFLTRVAG